MVRRGRSSVRDASPGARAGRVPNGRSLRVDSCEQDLHGANILAAEREPWLVIDPKPLVGERELEASGLLRNTRDVSRWLDVLVELGFDRERARGWGVAHNLAWAWDERHGWLEQHVEEARRILNAR